MPYISADQVKAVRNGLKKKFPAIKFSIRKRHSSTICIVVLASPFAWSKDYQQINHFYPQNHEHTDFLKEVIEIADNGNKILYEDSDYGNIPQFYLDISIGDWNRPHVQTK